MYVKVICIQKSSILRVKLMKIPFSLNQTSKEMQYLMQWNISFIMGWDLQLQTKERKKTGGEPYELRSVSTFCCLP